MSYTERWLQEQREKRSFVLTLVGGAIGLVIAVILFFLSAVNDELQSRCARYASYKCPEYGVACSKTLPVETSFLSCKIQSTDGMMVSYDEFISYEEKVLWKLLQQEIHRIRSGRKPDVSI